MNYYFKIHNWQNLILFKLWIGSQSVPCWCGDSDDRNFCSNIGQGKTTQSLYCHKDSATCRKGDKICAAAKYFHIDACIDMTVKTCAVKEEYSSPSSITDFFVGSTANDAICTKCPLGQIQPKAGGRHKCKRKE